MPPTDPQPHTSTRRDADVPTSDPGSPPATAADQLDTDLYVADLAHDVRAICMRVARRVRYEADNELAPHLVSILARLSHEPRTVGELATIEQVSAPSMSRSVTHLCERGYVVRSADEHDGRVVRLSLTQAGLDLFWAERLRRDRWMTSRLETLTPGQRTVLREATDLLETVLDR